MALSSDELIVSVDRQDSIVHWRKLNELIIEDLGFYFAFANQVVPGDIIVGHINYRNSGNIVYYHYPLECERSIIYNKSTFLTFKYVEDEMNDLFGFSHEDMYPNNKIFLAEP